MIERKSRISEDWLSLWTGLAVFLLSLGVFLGADVLGFGAKVGTWTDLSKAITPVAASFRWMPGWLAVVSTYLFMGLVVGVGNWLSGGSLKKFAVAFTLVFAISFVCWVAGNHAHIAATTPAELTKFGISWSLKLTGEAGFVLALLAGLIIGNFFPQLSGLLKEAIRPELFVKAAIVIMGAGVGIKALENSSLAWGILFRGFCAIIEAYLIYWAVIYFIARKHFKFNREWAAPPGVGHFHLRRLGGDRNGRCDPGAAGGAHHGLLLGGGVRRGGVTAAAVSGSDFPVEGAARGRRLDGAGGQNRWGSDRRGRHNRCLDPGEGGGQWRRV